MNKFKRIKRYFIEYVLVIIFFILLTVVGCVTAITGSEPGQEWLIFCMILVVFGSLIAFYCYLCYQYIIMYKNVKKIDSDYCEKKKIFVYKSSLVIYSGGKYVSTKYSAIKLYCKEKDIKYVLYYIFEKDVSLENKKDIVKGYLEIELYSNTNLVKSLGSKLDKKIYFR